jgi:hypothetical protein
MRNYKKIFSFVLFIVILCTISSFSIAEANSNTDIENSEILNSETYTADEVGAIVTFDKDSTILKVYEHVLANNEGISDKDAYKIAKKMAEVMEKAQKDNLLSKDNPNKENKEMSSANNVPERIIAPLGHIVDGKFIDDYQSGKGKLDSDNITANYIPTSQQTIISEGWTVNPYMSHHVLWVNYVVTWYGLDCYKSASGGTYEFTHDVSVSKSLGFQGTLSAEDAINWGLQVSSSITVTSKISEGTELNVGAWHKTVERPYIYYYKDQYDGTYEYLVYDHIGDYYFTVTENRTSYNSYDIEHTYRVWSRVNEEMDPSATAPIPPAEC